MLFFCRFFLMTVIAVCFFSSCVTTPEPRKREADARMRMGITYLQQDNIPMAMRELLQASELDPNNAEIDMMLGIAYRARGDGKKAEEYLRSAISKNPDYADAHNNLGIVLADRKAWDEAIREFQKAYDNVKYTTPEWAIYNSAEAYFHKGDKNKAEEQYRYALKVNPAYAPACGGLASLLFEKGQRREAEETLTRCLKLAPDYEDGWMRLGVMYVAMKRRTEAIEAFNKVLSLTTDPAVEKEANRYLSVLGVRK